MNTKKILLVEDDQAFVDLIKLALRDFRFEIQVVEDGQSALDLISKIQFDLIISDYRLPRAHGVEIARAAKKTSPKCQIVLISAADSELIASDTEHLDLLGFLQKPFSPGQLREVVSKIAL
ncbi:MAG: response regulator [bacterium]